MLKKVKCRKVPNTQVWVFPWETLAALLLAEVLGLVLAAMPYPKRPPVELQPFREPGLQAIAAL